MKKITLIIICLIFVTASLFSQENVVKGRIVGETGSRIAYDIDDNYGGIASWARAGIQLDWTITPIDRMGEPPVYGFIQVLGMGEVLTDNASFRLGWYNSADPEAMAWSQNFGDQGCQNNTSIMVEPQYRGAEPDNPEIIAKLYIEPFFIKYDGNVSLDADMELQGELLKYKTIQWNYLDQKTSGGVGASVNNLEFDTDYGSRGAIEMGYESDIFDIYLKVASSGVGITHWFASLSDRKYFNEDNGWAGGAEIALRPVEKFEINLCSYAGINYSENPIFGGAKAAYIFDTGDGITFKPYIGAEAKLNTDSQDIDGDFDEDEYRPIGNMEKEIGGGIEITWPGSAGAYVWDMGRWFRDNNGWAMWPNHYIHFSGMVIYGALLGTEDDSGLYTNTINGQITLFDDNGDAGLIPMFGIGLKTFVNDLLNANPTIGFSTYISYDVGDTAVLFTHCDVLFNRGNAAANDSALVALGIQIVSIQHMFVTLKWDSNNILTSAAPTGGKIYLELLAEFY